MDVIDGGTYSEKVVEVVVTLSLIVTSEGILEIWEVDLLEDPVGVGGIVTFVIVDIVTVDVTSEGVGSGVVLSKPLDSGVVKIIVVETLDMTLVVFKVEGNDDGSELDGLSGSGVELDSKVVDRTEVELE